MSVKVSAKAIKISPRKAGVVASLIRGRSVDDALVILNHTPKKAAGMISKVIANAKASAMRNHNFQEHGLQITEITISPGPTMKRFRPQAFGRAAPYRRRTSHVRVILDGNVKVTKKTVAKSSKKPLSAVKTVTKKETK